jgi:hypothetical protein
VAAPFRSTEEVFEDHLRCRSAGTLEEDLQRNYAEDVVLLCERGALRGRDQVRCSAERLRAQVPDGKYEYLTRHCTGEYAFLRWRARSDASLIDNGADSYVIHEGRIIMQSVSYAFHRAR